jgi:hypothetical protein
MASELVPARLAALTRTPRPAQSREMGIGMDVDLAFHGQHGQVLTRSEDLGAKWEMAVHSGDLLAVRDSTQYRRQKCRHLVGGVALPCDCCFVGAGRSAAGDGANDAPVATHYHGWQEPLWAGGTRVREGPRRRAHRSNRQMPRSPLGYHCHKWVFAKP